MVKLLEPRHDANSDACRYRFLNVNQMNEFIGNVFNYMRKSGHNFAANTFPTNFQAKFKYPAAFVDPITCGEENSPRNWKSIFGRSPTHCLLLESIDRFFG